MFYGFIDHFTMLTLLFCQALCDSVCEKRFINKDYLLTYLLTTPQQALKMGVKVPGTQYSFWCERDIRGTNGTKREKYGEKSCGVNTPVVAF